MEITILERDDDITHIVLSGRLDATAAEEMDKSFSEATAARSRPAIIDLSGIEFIASRGIALLFTNSKKLKKSGHMLVLLKPQGMVAAVLKSSKMDMLMPITYDLDEGIGILQGVHGAAGASRVRHKAPIVEARPQQQESVSANPAASSSVLKMSLENELSALETLNAAVAQFLDVHSVPSRAAYAVNLALEELFMNVIRYAYVDDDTHLIDVEVAIDSDQIVLRIVDDGRPFDPREGPELDLHAEDREVGGLGLVLVLDLVDLLKYKRVDEKNWVEVRISLAAKDESDDGSETTG